MSRSTLTSATVGSFFAQETEEVYLVLLTIDHDELSVPIRVSSDIVNTTSRGEEFIGYPFEILLPSDEEGAPPRAQVVIDNVHREICNSLRSISSPASFTIEVIRAANPDTVEVSWDNFELKNVRGDVFQVSGELTISDVITEPFPADAFTPSKFRGLFS